MLLDQRWKILLVCIFNLLLTILAQQEQQMFSVAQKLMSQAGDIPSAIQDGFAGKSDGIRKIVSSALGGGLISQLIENPIKAAGNMGFNLEQYGLNGTMLENAFKLPNHVPNLGNMNLLNNSIQGGELLFNSGLMGFNNPFSTSTPSTTPIETTPEVVYIDGRPLLRPEILSDIIGGQHEGENSNSPGNRFPDFPSYRREHEAPYMILPPGGQHGLPPQPPYLHQRGPNHIHRMYEYQHTTPSTTTTTTTVPSTTTNPMANLISIANSLGFFSPKEVSTPPPQVVVVEKYATPPPPPSPLPPLPPQNPNSLNDELAILEAIRKVQNKEVEVRRSPPAFNPEILQMREKIQQLEARLTEQQELLAKHEVEEKEIKLKKLLDVIKFGKTRSSRISSLQKHFRYSPTDHDELKLDASPLPSFDESKCECIPVDIERLKGKWNQALASGQLLKKMRFSVGQLLDTQTETHLNCTTLEIGHAKKSDSFQYTHFVWTFRTSPGSQNYRLQGNLILLESNQMIFRSSDFNDNIINIPICILKSGQTETSYNYLVVVDSNSCNQASLFVKETFFGETYHELTKFLQHKISSNEMDLMESVEHASNCPAY